jgi:NTP pyrophosphatase (non-canonical NTP hydrolase)
MTKKVDLSRYANFVDGVTSDPSKDYKSFIESLSSLDGKGANIHRLLTAAVGISAEGGEFMEIVKKMVFQGKPWNDDNRKHLTIELGDVMWYVMQACMALEIPLDEVIAGNVEKLKKRYPGGEFNVYQSENRAKGDL